MAARTPKRRRFFLANWKMNVSARKAQSLAAELRAAIEHDPSISDGCDVVIAPPLLAIPAVAQELAGSSIELAAPDMHWEAEGPFTGEVSAPALQEFGVSCLLVGHSERRDLFHEDDERINRKLRAALRHGMRPVLCIGEHAPERKAGRVLEVVLGQLQRGLEGIDSSQLARTVVAYEPVWAIGTGLTAQPREVELVHGSIRSALGDGYSQEAAAAVRIVYGGSVTPASAASFLSQPNVDGVIVGAASLKAELFMGIVKAGVRLELRGAGHEP